MDRFLSAGSREEGELAVDVDVATGEGWVAEVEEDLLVVEAKGKAEERTPRSLGV